MDELDREARQLARRLRGTLPKASPERAFRVRLEMGGLVARLLGHDPRLPKAIWGRRNGMQKLKSAFAEFEARIVPKANEFMDEVLAAR